MILVDRGHLLGPLHLQIPLHPLATLMLRGEHRSQQFVVHHEVLVGRAPSSRTLETLRTETLLYRSPQPLQPQLLAVLGERGGERRVVLRSTVRGRLGGGGEGSSWQLVVRPRRLQSKDLDPFYQLFYARAQVHVARRG